MSKIIFGPINSRRFGRSLGIDLSPNKKLCNYDCVYCELSPAKPVSKNDEPVSFELIFEEVKKVLESKLDFDILTLTANGEPSLYPYLKELIIELKKIKKDKKLLILSNGTAVLDEAKFEALLELDIVKLSLDSALEKSFFRIDRALKSINLKKMIEKMAEFSKLFKGDLIMESLIIKDINDNEEDFLALNEAFYKIRPLRLDISSLDRPPAYPVKPVSKERLESLSKLITSVPVLLPSRHFEGKKLDFSKDELLKMLHLRAQSELDIEAKFSALSRQNLKELLEAKKIKELSLGGVKFYKS
ncbi:radical SAM protein [Campylobacter sp. MIT 99-7217]|uniref:radical SAM protein n=1 Tax=Campylobacter sp. MIT 99-7217 TaxID=535091 RepID=UPI001157EEF9|nr:radical SAM protein [Campylobacter sp. MIT 99-7217]TQR33703.1 radical SAM protein [Campylobacter sp. MIT 99-7217]